MKATEKPPMMGAKIMGKGAMSPVKAGNTKVKRAKVPSKRIGATKGASGKHGSGYGKGR